MSVRIKLFDKTEYVVTDAEAELINEAMTRGEKYIQLENSTFAISSIDHMDSLSQRASTPPHMLPSGKKPVGFEIPADFYSEETMAKRRAENKIKYAPQWQKDQWELEKSISAKVAGADEE